MVKLFLRLCSSLERTLTAILERLRKLAEHIVDIVEAAELAARRLSVIAGTGRILVIVRIVLCIIHPVKDLRRSLQEAGFHTALDNFGVGSSFINLIADVPLNDVKLGRGFMEKCEKDYRGIGFLRQMIGMLKSLGFQVLCEGVESARQVEVLKTSGCDHVQGNWFSMPLSAKEFEKMFSKFQNDEEQEIEG